MDFQCLQDVKDYVTAIASDRSKVTYATILQTSVKFTKAKGKKKCIDFSQFARYLISTFTQLEEEYNYVKRLVVSIRNILIRFNVLLKRVTRDSCAIQAFVCQAFHFPTRIDVQPPPDLPVLRPINNVSQSPVKASTPPVVTTIVKTRTDCDKCYASKKVSITLEKSLKEKKSEHRKLKSFTANLKEELGIKAKIQRLSRQERKIRDLKDIVRKCNSKIRRLQNNALKVRNGYDECLQELGLLQIKNAELVEEVMCLTQKEQALKKELNETKAYCEFLGMDNSDNSHDSGDGTIIVSKKGKAYSPEIRRLIYMQLVCDVPVKHCGVILSAFAKIMVNKTLKDVPSPSTCAQMAYELGVITTIQLMEFLLTSAESHNICLSWDATTIDGVHINEIHLTVDKTSCLMLDVRHLPGGRAADYVTHIVSALTEAADVYSRYSGTPTEEIFTAVKSAITSTLTDRAVVNACVTRQLRDELDTQLMQLNCNIHPLDSIARYSRINLRHVDTQHGIVGNCFGSDGTATNLINAVSVLRFKDGAGDPVGFKNMLRHYDLPVGTFVRYVGNRIHVLFHLAGILVLHWSKVKDFVKMQSTAGGLLRSRLIKDLSNDGINAQVWALGVMGKVFSGPWMTKFYSSDMSNLDMRPFVQSCVQQLQAWSEMPEVLFNPATDVFGQPLSSGEDNVLSALHSFVSGEVDVQRDALSGILKSCLTVLRSQLSSFLTGDEPPSEVKEKVSSAPTHNMASERALGCYDKMFRRAPVATGGFLNGKVRSKMNKSTQWLDSQPPVVRDSIINFAIREAREDRVKQCVNDRLVKEEIGKRRFDAGIDKVQKDKKSVVKAVTLVLKKKKSVGDLDCSEFVKTKITSYVEEPEVLVGHCYIQSLADHSELYGRIQCVDVVKQELEVGFWEAERSESSSVDQIVSVISFFADVIVGSVVFL